MDILYNTIIIKTLWCRTTISSLLYQNKWITSQIQIEVILPIHSTLIRHRKVQMLMDNLRIAKEERKKIPVDKKEYLLQDLKYSNQIFIVKTVVTAIQTQEVTIMKTLRKKHQNVEHLFRSCQVSKVRLLIQEEVCQVKFNTPCGSKLNSPYIKIQTATEMKVTRWYIKAQIRAMLKWWTIHTWETTCQWHKIEYQITISSHHKALSRSNNK